MKNCKKLSLDEFPEPPINKDFIKNKSFKPILEIIEGKSGEFGRIFSIIMFILIFAFLFYGILPGQENKFYKVCAAGENYLCYEATCTYDNQDCDTSVGNDGFCDSCTSQGGSWSIGGEVDPTVCCGDDATDNSIIEIQGTDASSKFDDAANLCCDTSTDCVEATICIPTGTVTGIGIDDGYCNAGSWEGGDAGQTQCEGLSDIWISTGIGGNSGCCGDDTAADDFNSTDSNGNNLCYNGTVLSDGSVLGSILNVNGSMYDCGGIADDDSDIGFHVVGQSCTSYESLYCQSNNSWNSDFSGEWACDCTMGSSPSYWNLGGETASTTCCEIDGGNRATRISDSTMDNEYVTSSSDDACCSHITDCVNGSDCYASPDISTDIDVDGDFDYCNSGIWYDCNTDSECKTGDPCINNECIEINEFIEISNIGQTGFDQVNPEYTSIRSVILHLNYSSFVNKCRFINYDNPYVLPVTDNENWTGWENCVSTKFWQLSERSGLKTVYYQLNYTNGIGPSDMKNDSINYNFSGAGLDLSTPSNVEIDFGGYTNINTTLSASWSKATDFESDILRILILYNYSIFQNNDLIFSDIIDDLSFRKSGFNFSHEDNITINITTINSAGIQNNTKSNNLVIDLEPPGAVSIVSKLFKNRSTNTWQSLDESVWTNAKQVKFIWSATDDLSGIGAYSYLLTDVSTKYPDDIPEGSVGLFAVANEITLNLNSGQKYFRVKARDVAGSWGPNAISGESIFKIDNTHPSRPLLTNQEYNPDDQSVIYTWSESIDEESDISLYQINLTDNNDNLLDTFFVDGSETSGKYNSTFDQEIIIIIGAKNGAGLWRWSNQEDIDIDTEPPKILSTSEGTVIESTFLLYLNTNEDTTCYYTESGRTNKFLYTNTTYHEAKVTYSDGNYNFLVECLDNTLNSNTTTFVVKVNTDEEVTEVNIPSSFTSYVNTLTFFTLNVTNSTTRLGGISRESFNVVLDENNIDFKIDEIESGLYSIGIEGVENGTYSLKVNVNGIESNIMDLGIEDLYFNIIYSDNRLGNILNTDKISYGEIYNLDAGIASASETFIRDSQGSLFDVTVDYDNYAHIFLTYEIIGIGSKNKILKKDDFLNKQNPSFGYSINDYFVINLILDYYDLDITTDAERELKGKNNLFIKKIRSSSGKRTVYLSNDLE